MTDKLFISLPSSVQKQLMKISGFCQEMISSLPSPVIENIPRPCLDLRIGYPPSVDHELVKRCPPTFPANLSFSFSPKGENPVRKAGGTSGLSETHTTISIFGPQTFWHLLRYPHQMTAETEETKVPAVCPNFPQPRLCKVDEGSHGMPQSRLVHREFIKMAVKRSSEHDFKPVQRSLQSY